MLFERKLPSGVVVSCEGGPLGSVQLPVAWTDRELFGLVASVPTVWRTLGEIG